MKKSGFTLVELSIALLIIGMLVGGILVGREMIRASELRTIIADRDKINGAISAFNAKYGMLPGDITNATTYFGNAASFSGTCGDGSSLETAGTKGTCNGDGDGIIGNGWTRASEYFTMWQQLSYARLLEGQYSGVGGPTRSHFTVGGTNVPKSRVAGAAFHLLYMSKGYSDANYYSFDYPYVLLFGAEASSNAAVLDGPAGPSLTVSEAMAMDQKIDDGRPDTGIIHTWKNGGFNSMLCANAATPPAYDITQTGPRCALLMGMDF